MNLADLPPLAPEEAARADHYALLARLFRSPPDAALLATLADLGATAQGELASAWRGLAAAAAGLDADAAREEYERLFVGVGRPQIFLYASYYQAGFLMEEPLAVLRDDLAALGLARLAGVGEPEDHIAALAEVMRQLIARGAPLAGQKRFFARHLQPWCGRLAADLERAPAAFYPSAGRLLGAYFVVEAEAFSMA